MGSFISLPRGSNRTAAHFADEAAGRTEDYESISWSSLQHASASFIGSTHKPPFPCAVLHKTQTIKSTGSTALYALTSLLPPVTIQITQDRCLGRSDAAHLDPHILNDAEQYRK